MEKHAVGFASVRDMIPGLKDAPFLHEFLHYIDDLTGGTASLLPQLGIVIPFMQYELNCRGFRQATWRGHDPAAFQMGSLILADSGEGKTTGVSLYQRIHYEMRQASGSVSASGTVPDRTHPGVVPFKNTEAGAFTFAKACYVDPEKPDVPAELGKGIAPFILFTDEATGLFQKLANGDDLADFFNDVMTGASTQKNVKKLMDDWDGEGVPAWRLINPRCSSVLMAPLEAVRLGGTFDAKVAVSGFLGRQFLFPSEGVDHAATIKLLKAELEESVAHVKAREAKVRAAREADRAAMVGTLTAWTKGLNRRAIAGHRIVDFTDCGAHAMLGERLRTQEEAERVQALPAGVSRAARKLFLKRVDVAIATIAGFYATLSATPASDKPFQTTEAHVKVAASLVRSRYAVMQRLIEQGLLDGKSADPQRDRLRERLFERLHQEKARGNLIVKRRDLLQRSCGKNRQVLDNAIDDLVDAEDVLFYDNGAKGRYSVRLLALSSETEAFAKHLKDEYGVELDGYGRLDDSAALEARYAERAPVLAERGMGNRKGKLTLSIYQKLEELAKASPDGRFEYKGQTHEWPLEWCSPEQRKARNPLD
jgi:hypothetical protein